MRLPFASTDAAQSVSLRRRQVSPIFAQLIHNLHEPLSAAGEEVLRGVARFLKKLERLARGSRRSPKLGGVAPNGITGKKGQNGSNFGFHEAELTLFVSASCGCTTPACPTLYIFVAYVRAELSTGMERGPRVSGPRGNRLPREGTRALDLPLSARSGLRTRWVLPGRGEANPRTDFGGGGHGGESKIARRQVRRGKACRSRRPCAFSHVAGGGIRSVCSFRFGLNGPTAGLGP